ncbi:stalk domain-containing protein [Clostridium disporicum]|uniref:stalk domain-containing protein n=1 Tax=Clostridium disporicum TaxID=84024 RepID=UPI0034A50FAE
MNKKISSSLMLALAMSQLAPYAVHAEETINAFETNDTNKELTEKYPNLIIPDKKDMINGDFSEETKKAIDEILLLLDEIEVNFDSVKLDEVFKKTTDLAEVMDTEDVTKHREKDNSEIDYILYRGTYLAFTKLDGEAKEKAFLNYMDMFYLSSAKRLNSGQTGVILDEYAKYYGYSLNEYFSYKTNAKLSAGASMMITLGSYVPGKGEEQGMESEKPNFPTEDKDLPSAYEPLPEDFVHPDNPDELIPEYSEPTYPEYETPEIKPEDGVNYEDGSGSSTGQGLTSEEYVYKNNKCYLITTKYNYTGEVVSTVETETQSSMCGTSQSDIIDGDVWNSTHTENSNDFVLDVWNSLTQNQLNQNSKYTLQFTIDKSSDSPYYFDSKIKTTTDKTVTYTQLKDVLLQISIKANGFLIEDDGKLLFVSEGKPLVLKDKKSEYTEKEVLELLNLFENIGLKIDERKTNETESLLEQSNKGELSKVIIDGKEVSLSQPAVLQDGVLQLPIVEIAKALSIDVKASDNTITLTKDDVAILYEVGTKNIKINDNKKILSSSTQSKNGLVYGEMSLVLKELGYELVYDSLTGNIEIK